MNKDPTIFRDEYTWETGYATCTDSTAANRSFPSTYTLHNNVREYIGKFTSHPTWKYVEWLENELLKVRSEKQAQKE